MLSLMPKAKREEVLKEYEEIEVQILSELGDKDKKMVDAIKEALETEFGLDPETEEFTKRIKEEFSKIVSIDE